MKRLAALAVLAAMLALAFWHTRSRERAKRSAAALPAPAVKPVLSPASPVRMRREAEPVAKAKALREAKRRAEAQAAADKAEKEAADKAAAEKAAQAQAAADKAAKEAAEQAAALKAAQAQAAAAKAAQEAAARLQVSSHTVVAPQGITQGQKNWAQCCADAGGAWSWGPEDGDCWDDASCQAKWGCCAGANYNDKVAACRFARNDRGHFRARFRCLGQ
jgi:hypothetical protein